MKLTVRRVGNSSCVILPKEAMYRLKVSEGDALFLTETADGYAVSAYDPEFEADMELARAFMKKRRKVFRELAK